ncbi:MAG: CDP-alcohol phosphatidyltransferase family protein [Candidatus Contendobacter sp.]|nr:CDP-alcohol phosphatidyltransferase family protein [Candidatus Contendobacter sp.]
MNRSTASPFQPLLINTLLNVFPAILLLAGAAGAMAKTFQLPASYAVQSVVVLIGLLIALLPFLPQHQPLQRFGAANAVTLLRAGIAALAAGLIGQMIVAPDLLWLMTALAGIALMLDGMDGWLARRSQMQSGFGARFDMEVDAFFILVLAALVYQMDKAGVWVLLSGAMRYGFVALGCALPWLRQPLPPRKRRQTVCVFQTAILVLCLSPPLIPPWTTRLTAVALGLLTLSFLVDAVWLARSHLSGMSR